MKQNILFKKLSRSLGLFDFVWSVIYCHSIKGSVSSVKWIDLGQILNFKKIDLGQLLSNK